MNNLTSCAKVSKNLSISVAMCTYNGSHYLREQLDSIASQKRHPDELIVCDDRSSDTTVALLTKFAETTSFPVRIFINNRNLGSTKNFEKAIKLCEGDIIMLSDQDDVWDPGKLSLMEYIFSSHGDVGGVFSNALLIDTDLMQLDNSLWGVIGFTNREQQLVRDGKAFDALLRHNIVTGATFGFRSEYRKHFIPIPDKWVHDGWIALIISTLSRLELIGKCLILYRQHSENQIGVQRKTLIERFGESLAIDRFQYYKEEITRYEDALIKMYEDLDQKHPAIKKIKQKLNHLQKRSQLPQNRLLRIPGILGGLLAMRYHRYSTGWQVAVRDFIIP